MIPFGEWLPDQSDLGSVGTTVATNVIPAARGYRPFLGLAELSAATDAHLRGFFGSIDSGGTVHLFAGNATKLLKLNNTTAALTDVKSSAYTLASDDQWKFVQFGNSVYAASGLNNLLQKIHHWVFKYLCRCFWVSKSKTSCGYKRLCCNSKQ